jgi:hypothetical protein
VSAGRKPLPPPSTDDVLSRRFSVGGPPVPSVTAPEPGPTPHMAHTPRTDVPSRISPAERRGEPDGMVRRTYYYSERVADALAAAVDRIHYDSRGRIPKHVALDALISAGVERVDDIVARLLTQP